MSHWNYRVIKHPAVLLKDKDGNIVKDEDSNPIEEPAWFAIHEVYYDDNNNPTSCTKEPCCPFGESIEELNDDSAYMLRALSLPVLEYSLFEKEDINDLLM